MIEIRQAGTYTKYCRTCHSRDTNDPKSIAFETPGTSVTMVITLCKQCRAELKNVLLQEEVE